MIVQKASQPLSVEFKPSKKLGHLVILIHALALVAGFANTSPLVVKLVVALVIGLHFKWIYPKLLHEQHKLKYSEKRGWELSNGGDFAQVDVLQSTVLTTKVIFLHLRNKPALIIANDALSESDFRQLLVKLKMTALIRPQNL